MTESYPIAAKNNPSPSLAGRFAAFVFSVPAVGRVLTSGHWQGKPCQWHPRSRKYFSSRHQADGRSTFFV